GQASLPSSRGQGRKNAESRRCRRDRNGRSGSADRARRPGSFWRTGRRGRRYGPVLYYRVSPKWGEHSGAPEQMKIASIETIVLRIPYTSGGSTDTEQWGGKAWQTADALLVKVTTDDGLTGWG